MALISIIFAFIGGLYVAETQPAWYVKAKTLIVGTN